MHKRLRTTWLPSFNLPAFAAILTWTAIRVPAIQCRSWPLVPGGLQMKWRSPVSKVPFGSFRLPGSFCYPGFLVLIPSWYGLPNPPYIAPKYLIIPSKTIVEMNTSQRFASFVNQHTELINQLGLTRVCNTRRYWASGLPTAEKFDFNFTATPSCKKPWAALVHVV